MKTTKVWFVACINKDLFYGVQDNLETHFKYMMGLGFNISKDAIFFMKEEDAKAHAQESALSNVNYVIDGLLCGATKKKEFVKNVELDIPALNRNIRRNNFNIPYLFIGSLEVEGEMETNEFYLISKANYFCEDRFIRCVANQPNDCDCEKISCRQKYLYVNICFIIYIKTRTLTRKKNEYEKPFPFIG